MGYSDYILIFIVLLVFTYFSLPSDAWKKVNNFFVRFYIRHKKISKLILFLITFFILHMALRDEIATLWSGPL